MTVEPLPPTPVLRQRVLASVEPTTLFEGFSDRFAEMFDISLEEARALAHFPGSSYHTDDQLHYRRAGFIYTKHMKCMLAQVNSHSNYFFANLHVGPSHFA
jgi:hypothetical protein